MLNKISIDLLLQYYNSIPIMCWFIRIPSSWQILVYQKRIEVASKSRSKLFGIIPYMDPKRFSGKNLNALNENIDIYSVGVLLWEISSGTPPFCNGTYE